MLHVRAKPPVKPAKRLENPPSPVAVFPENSQIALSAIQLNLNSILSKVTPQVAPPNKAVIAAHKQSSLFAENSSTWKKPASTARFKTKRSNP